MGTRLVNLLSGASVGQLTFPLRQPRDGLHLAVSVNCLPAHTVLRPNLYRPGQLGHD